MDAPLPGYRLIVASEAGTRDGLGLELTREDGSRLAEVFADETTGQRTFALFTETAVPAALIEWLILEAKTRI